MREQTAVGLKGARGRPETVRFSQEVALRYLLKSSNEATGKEGLVRESHRLLFLFGEAWTLLKWLLSEPPER